MDNSIHSIQPYFVFNTSAYYKKCMHDLGISHFYEFVCDNQMSSETVVVPDGAVDVIFHCDKEAPEAVMYGSVSRASKEYFTVGKRYFGARFLPGCVSHFWEVSAGDLLIEPVSFTEINGLRQCAYRIAEAKDFDERIGIFLAEIMPSVGTNLISADASLTSRILREIHESHGTIRQADLERDLFYSSRHLNRVFLENTGFTIKHYSRYIRFQTMLQLLRESQGIRIFEASEESGYYDQNHMQKEFREFARTTPGKFSTLLQQGRYLRRIIEK